MTVSRNQIAAVVGIGASAFLWFKAAQRLRAAVKATDKRPWDLILAGIVAVGALIVAVQRTEKAFVKVEEALEPRDTEGSI